MQVSNDVQMLLPVLVAILVAKGFADAVEPHSYYHAVMDAAKMPFLIPKPHTKVNMDLVTVRAVMATPVHTIPCTVRLADVEALLRDTSHNGFPVVQAAVPGAPCLGLVTRNVLLVRFVVLPTRLHRIVAASVVVHHCSCTGASAQWVWHASPVPSHNLLFMARPSCALRRYCWRQRCSKAL